MLSNTRIIVKKKRADRPKKRREEVMLYGSFNPGFHCCCWHNDWKPDIRVVQAAAT
jgi:hypothetical protein